MDTATSSIDSCRLTPSARPNWQPPLATSGGTTTISTVSSPSVHSPSFASSSSSTSASHRIRYIHHRRRRLSKSNSAVNRAEDTATYNAYAVVAAAAAASPSFPSSPCSPDSASLSPLGLFSAPSPLSEVAFAFLKSDFPLRPFPPEAVAALLVLSQQLERSSRLPSRYRNTLPPSAFGGKCESHVRPVLLLDVRTFVRHSESRICSAVNISIPNAMLKRPSFTIDKIRDTLSSKRDRSLLKEWSSYANIIIYDANSVTLHDTGVICCLSRKFRQENCTAELGWLYGGFDGFSRRYTELCETSSPRYDPNSSKLLLSSCLSNLSCENLSSQLSPPTTADDKCEEQSPQPAKFKTSHLLPDNHLDGSTGPLTCPSSSTFSSEGRCNTLNPFAESLQKRNEGEIARYPQTANIAVIPGANSNGKLALSSIVSPSVGETVAIRLPPCSMEVESEDEPTRENQPNRTATLNNASGRWSQSKKYTQKPKSTEDASASLVSEHEIRLEAQMNAHHVPQFLKELAIGQSAEEKLAKNFQTVEKTEQRRLQSLMLHHARYPTTDHPFSISAGVECGEKNRYVNIWPYDYTRVRVRRETTPAGGVQKTGGDSDYINANFIKAPHCDQKYIATQGPLPATFNDFWNVVWNEGVKVIVMLTREEEGGRVKCHRYWPDQKEVPLNYGPAITVEILDKETLPEGDDSITRRHFRMRYLPTGATRIIVQLQYIGWPDFGVPDTPLAVLQLRAAVLAGPRIHEKLIEGKPESPQDRPSPILVHCSAGCGRTGAFCTIDSTLRLLERPDGPFGCLNEAAIADDIVLAKHEAEIEAQNIEKAEREESKLPLALSAFSTGSFSVAAALKPEPTPGTFCLKMPKFLKGNRRGAALVPSEGTQAANNIAAKKSIQATDVGPPGAALQKQNVVSSTTACVPSESKMSSQLASNELHPPIAPSVQMGPSAHFKPLPYPNLLPSAESRCTRDIVRGCVEVFREQRLSMVQTLRQFVFCYEAVLWQLMGEGVCKKEAERADSVACCGRSVEKTRRHASSVGKRKAKTTEEEHTCDDPSMRPSIQSPLPKCRSPMVPQELTDPQPSGDALFRFNSFKPSEKLPGPLCEPDARENKLDTVTGTASKSVIPTVPSSREAAVRQTDPVDLVLPPSMRAKIRRGLDRASSERHGSSRVKNDGKSAECPCATDETKGDASTAIDVATLSVTSVSTTFTGSHKYISTSNTNRSQGTSQGTSQGLLESGEMEPGPFSSGSSLNPLGSRNGDSLQGDVLNAVIQTTTEDKESATQDKTENSRTRTQSMKRKEVEDYFSVRPVVSPPLHLSVCVLGDDTAKHHVPCSLVAAKPTSTAQLSPCVTDATTMIGTPTFAFQNSTPRSPSTAFVAVSSSLFSLNDVYGRRRSDPCVAVNALSFIRNPHDDPVIPGASATSPSSCHLRPGHHLSKFERILRDTTAKKLSLRSHHLRSTSSASESSNQDYLYHTRSVSAGGAGFGPVGLSPTLLSH